MRCSLNWAGAILEHGRVGVGAECTGKETVFHMERIEILVVAFQLGLLLLRVFIIKSLRFW